MRFKWWCIVLLILVSCRKKDYESVKLIGHAGSGLSISTAIYSDNTAESVQYALEMEGIDGVEIDIQCSADGTAWLFHDPELDESTSGSGCVPSSTDTYLESLHYTTFQKESLIKLADLQAPFNEKVIFLDIRAFNHCTETAIDQHAMIIAIQQALPDVPNDRIFVITNRPAWVNDLYLAGWNVYLETVTAEEYLGVSQGTLDQTVGTCLRNGKVDKNEVESIHEQSKEVIIFDVRSPKPMRKALKKAPDYILVDDLKGAIIEKY